MDADPGYNSQADDQVDADMEQAQLRLEQLRKEKEEVENSRRRLEECHMRKARFMDQQNELGDRMVNAADLIGREVESLRQESNELEQIHMALTRSLKMLSTVRPDEWPIENTDNLISQGQQVIDRCEEEFADAVQQCARMQHTKVLTGVRRSSKVRISSREFMTQFLQGLSFHLPLLLIALIILFSSGFQPFRIMIKRKTKRRSSELAELDRASREIESRIQELEASLKRPSQQTRMRLDRNTMPPPDRVREGNQNRALRAVVARDGRATNMRRELRENFMLLGLLICAIAVSFCWIVRLLEQQ